MNKQNPSASENVDFIGWEGSLEVSLGRNSKVTQRHPKEIFYKNINLVGNRGRKVGEGEAEDVRRSPYGITLRHMCIRVWKSAYMWFWLCVKVFMHSCFYTHCVRVCVSVCVREGGACTHGLANVHRRC